MKILTVCIPTYKRPVTLKRCIDSIVDQIEKFGLGDSVDLYVANDASPDETAKVLMQYSRLHYFNGVTREKNLGMNVNIKVMLTTLAVRSNYQLIMTDDDYLQSNVLADIVQLLVEQNKSTQCVPVIWTPRYSYTEDGELHDIVCASFPESAYIKASPSNVGRYTDGAFVLSGLIIRAECIDFNFWDEYSENAYFPVIFSGDLLLRGGAYYWNKSIAYHTVLNVCHWERWGTTDIMIHIRQAADFTNAYWVLAGRLDSTWDRLAFYLAARRSIELEMTALILSEDLAAHRSIALDALYKLREQGVLRFPLPVKALAIYGFLASTSKVFLKCLVFGVTSLLPQSEERKESHRRKFSLYKKAAVNAGIVGLVAIS